MNTSHLFEKLCHKERLWQSWLEVKLKKSSGGIDNISINDFDKKAKEEINILVNELQVGRYNPQPYKNFSIPKNNHSFRNLGLLTIRDKIVQNAMYNILYPIIDKQLSSCCYAYRKGKGAVKAVKRVQHGLKSEKQSIIITCDIKSYFDNIQHDMLFEMVKKLIQDDDFFNLLKLCIGMGKVKHRAKWLDGNIGVPQGSVLSPLLANLYLTLLDNSFTKLDVTYIRYADDFIILCKNDDIAKSSIEIIKSTCQTLGLSLKTDPVISSTSEEFVFLGICFSNNKVKLSDEKKTRMLEKIETAFKNEPDEIPEHLYKQINGYRAFYGKIIPQNELQFLDDAILKHIGNTIKKLNIKRVSDITKIFNKLQFITDDNEKNKSEIFHKLIQEQRVKTHYTPQKNEQLIKQRKKEYRKLESESSELIINTFGVFIGILNGKFNIKYKDRKSKTVPMVNVSHVTIMSKGISLSTDFLFQCSKFKIPVSFFTRQGEHFATIYSPNTTDSNLWLKQIRAIESGKGAKISTLLIEAKIKNQINLLKYFHKYHKRKDSSFADAFASSIPDLSEQVQKCKKINKIIDFQKELMAIESRAAMLYWKLVEELINDDCEFEGRERKGAKDLVNCLLNYGYAILYARIWEALLSVKLNPYISYLHIPDTYKPTLTFDFIEIFRQQVVDRVVISMLQKKEKLVVVNGILDEETRIKLASNIYERLYRYENYRGESRRFLDIMKIQAQHLAKFINDEVSNYKPYISKW
jgi:group II intron reverse transcriptase/maturase/CRISPR-associated endonuclease Cas1